MPSWYLEDADPIAAENPYTFYKPSREIISLIGPGEVVKLIFRIHSDDPRAPSGERMWVMVDERLPDGSFRGRLNNSPRHIADLKLDDQIRFDACHVIDTERYDNDNLPQRYSQRCFVSKRILDDGRRVGYCYRESPEAADDSGWCFTAHDESEAYLSQSSNVAYVAIGRVLNIDDSFLALLDNPIGSAFIRNSLTGQFEPENSDYSTSP